MASTSKSKLPSIRPDAYAKWKCTGSRGDVRVLDALHKVSSMKKYENGIVLYDLPKYVNVSQKSVNNIRVTLNNLIERGLVEIHNVYMKHKGQDRWMLTYKIAEKAYTFDCLEEYGGMEGYLAEKERLRGKRYLEYQQEYQRKYREKQKVKKED